MKIRNKMKKDEKNNKDKIEILGKRKHDKIKKKVEKKDKKKAKLTEKIVDKTNSFRKDKEGGANIKKYSEVIKSNQDVHLEKLYFYDNIKNDLDRTDSDNEWIKNFEEDQINAGNNLDCCEHDLQMLQNYK